MPAEYSFKKHILFDLDGTLVDSSDAHEMAYLKALEVNHPKLAETFCYRNHQGQPTKEVMRSLGVVAEVEICELTRRKQQLYRQVIDSGEINLFPGVLDMLLELKESGRGLYIVTGASPDSTNSVLQFNGIKSLFSGITTAGESILGKPSPDPYIRTLDKYYLPKNESIAIEDAANGVMAALSAELDVILVNTDLQIHGVDNIGPVSRLSKLF